MIAELTRCASDTELTDAITAIHDVLRALAPHYPNGRDYNRPSDCDAASERHSAALAYLAERAAEFEAEYKRRRRN
jgi:hypothetical protein